MEKSRNYVVFGVLALVVSLVAVSLAYAGFSQNLNINGQATISNVNWDVHFENLVLGTPVGTATWATQPAITNGTTSIGNYSATFQTPGDSLSFEFDVKDAGNFDAKLTGLTKGTLTCDTTDTNFQANCSSRISYTLAEKGGSTLSGPDNSVIPANGGKKTYVVTLTYNTTDDQTDLPTSNVTRGVLAIVFTYTQEDVYTAPQP